MPPLQFRSIWISDLHLGTRNLQSEQLLDFLQKTESNYLYLVGDILDLLQARKRWYWPRINDRIVQTILDKAKNGTKVIYIPGNHDHILRRFDGMVFNNIHICNKVVHETADGHRYLVIHGDKFDPVVQNSPWLASIGSTLYDLALTINRIVNKGRRGLGYEYRSVSAWLKQQVKVAVNYMGRFEEVVAQEGASNKVDGLICGHIHRAGIREIGQVLYSNSGDWVESCTALAENHNGSLGLVQWPEQHALTHPATGSVYEDLYRDRCLASPN